MTHRFTRAAVVATAAVSAFGVVLPPAQASPVRGAGVSASGVPAAGLDWALCKDRAKDWDRSDTRTECTTLAVPVDYRNPGGRQIRIAVSRLKATGARRGAMVVNPGGPGGSGIDLPRRIAGSTVGEVNRAYDLIGFDPRGVGYSDKIVCKPPADDEEDGTPGGPPLSEKEQARFYAEQRGRENRECAEQDAEFARNLSTENIARDVDRIRSALGERKISYYGISWGTALGAYYRSLFDRHVDKMLLDSVVTPRWDFGSVSDELAASNERGAHRFAAWVARYDSTFHFGTTGEEVFAALKAMRDDFAAHPRQVGEVFVDGDTIGNEMQTSMRIWLEAAGMLAELRDGSRATAGVPAATATTGGTGGFGYDQPGQSQNAFQQIAVNCNDSTGSRDFDVVWANRTKRTAAYPIAGGGSYYDGRCIGWPFAPSPWRLTPGTSPLQLVGHRFESQTPYGWALAMRERIGGTLLTVEDDFHGSLLRLPCGSLGVDFFETGEAASGTCPGAEIPAPGRPPRPDDPLADPGVFRITVRTPPFWVSRHGHH